MMSFKQGSERKLDNMRQLLSGFTGGELQADH